MNKQRIKDTAWLLVGAIAGLAISELIWLWAMGYPGILTRFILGL